MRPTKETAAEFMTRRDREQRRHYARKPKTIAAVLAQLITARGYGRVQANEDFTAAWEGAVGATIAQYSRPGRLRRGVLEVTVSNSMMVQELTFQKQDVIAKLQAEFPDAKLRDIRFRVGKVG
jgi:predicted nucleic acid-binding Zn ribbon protein